MADKKISALTAASTPLAGTEVLPIVQSGATVKVAVSDLTAGRAISATAVTASTGNFVVGTAGQGVDFSANTAAPGMTSELLTWYEEGTFTPTIGGDSVAGAQTYNTQVGFYTRIGNRVYFNLRIVLTAKDVTTAGNLIIGGLPFTSNNTVSNFHALAVGNAGFFTLTALYTQLEAHIERGLNYFYLGQIGSGLGYSYLQAAAFADNSRINISGHYVV